RVLIDNQEGAVVPVRPFLSGGKPHPIYARVVAKDGTETRVEVPVRAHDCRAQAFVSITTSALANTWDQYQLIARVLDAALTSEHAARPITPQDVESYSWDFGDGETARTHVPLIEHSYEGRAQDRPSTSYLVKVEARLRDGRRV